MFPPNVDIHLQDHMVSHQKTTVDVFILIIFRYGFLWYEQGA
jgi:hypothetical protein